MNLEAGSEHSDGFALLDSYSMSTLMTGQAYNLMSSQPVQLPALS